MLARNAPRLGTGDFRFDRHADAFGNLVLNQKHVGHAAVVALGVQVMTRGRLDQLYRDAESGPRSAGHCLRQGTPLPVPCRSR